MKKTAFFFMLAALALIAGCSVTVTAPGGTVVDGKDVSGQSFTIKVEPAQGQPTPAAQAAATPAAAKTPAPSAFRVLDMNECQDLTLGTIVVYKDYKYSEKEVVIGVHNGQGAPGSKLCREAKWPAYWRVVWVGFADVASAETYAAEEAARVAAAKDANPQAPGADPVTKVTWNKADGSTGDVLTP